MVFLVCIFFLRKSSFRPITMSAKSSALGHLIIMFSQNDQNLEPPTLHPVCTCSILVTLPPAKVQHFTSTPRTHSPAQH